jgi:hypothetical protein
VPVCWLGKLRWLSWQRADEWGSWLSGRNRPYHSEHQHARRWIDRRPVNPSFEGDFQYLHTAARDRQRAGSTPLDDQVDECFDRRIEVLNRMRCIDAAATAVAGSEFSRLVAHGEADGAGGHMRMLERAGGVGGGWTEDGRRRNLIAHEVDAASRRCRC